jgi:hypothetical protein
MIAALRFSCPLVALVLQLSVITHRSLAVPATAGGPERPGRLIALVPLNKPGSPMPATNTPSPVLKPQTSPTVSPVLVAPAIPPVSGWVVTALPIAVPGGNVIRSNPTIPTNTQTASNLWVPPQHPTVLPVHPTPTPPPATEETSTLVVSGGMGGRGTGASSTSGFSASDLTTISAGPNGQVMKNSGASQPGGSTNSASTGTAGNQCSGGTSFPGSSTGKISPSAAGLATKAANVTPTLHAPPAIKPHVPPRAGQRMHNNRNVGNYRK